MRFKTGFRILFGILFTLLSYLQESFAQEVKSQWFKPQFVYKTWDNKSGLPQNTVTDIVKDDEGYLWLATDEGLLRFDGHIFKVINEENTAGLFSSTFYDLCNSSKKGVWAASGNTVLFIGTGEIKTFDFRKDLQSSTITQIAEDNSGTLWVGTNLGTLFSLKDNSIRKLNSWTTGRFKSVNVLQPVSDGILIGTNRGLFKMKSGNHDIVNIAGYDSLNIRALAVAKDESVWIGTEENGLFHKTIKQTFHFSTNEGLYENFITALSLAPNGDVWVGTSSKGLQICKTDKFIDLEPKLSNDGAKRILFTGENLAWLGTTASGLIQIKPAEIQTLSVNYGLSESIILPIYQDVTGAVWMGSIGKGVSRISNGKVNDYTVKNGLASELPLTIYGSEEVVLIGTTNGMSRVNLKTGKIDRVYTMQDGLANNVVQAIYYDSEKIFWIATRSGGIHKMGKDGKITRINVPSQFSNVRFVSIYEDRNKNMWFGSKGSGVFRINSKNEISHYTVDDGLPSDLVDNFYEDDEGALWMGTEKGLVCYEDQKFKTFTKINGLQFNGIFRIVDDGHGYVWLSGNFGLQRIALSELKMLKQRQTKQIHIPVRIFGTADGMTNSEVNGGIFPAGWKMNDGSIWFPTVKGVAIVQPAIINNEIRPVNIRIQSMRFGDETHYLSQSLAVPAGISNIEIDYTCIDFIHSETINYYYRLKGLDNEWKSAGNRRTAYFTSLSPGEYTFEVKAQQFGKWSDTVPLSFTVKPFFYQTIWFKLLGVVLLFIAGFFVKQLHTKHRHEASLKALVDDRTKELKESNERLQVVIKAIEDQNIKLREIAWTQSHVVRAPVANLLGILNMLEYVDHANGELAELLPLMKKCALELDAITRDIAKKSEIVEKGFTDEETRANT